MPTPITFPSTTLSLVTPILPPNTTVLSVDTSVLPFVINGFNATTNPGYDISRVEIGIYNTLYTADNFSVVNGDNQFVLSVPLIPTVQETNVSIIGRNYDPTIQATITNVQISNNLLTVTAANSFQTGQQVYLFGLAAATFLNNQTVTVGTSTGRTFTTPFTHANYAVADSGTAESFWIPNTSYALGARYADPNGNVQIVVQGGVSSSTQPTWSILPPVTATSVSVTANVATILAVNSYSIGQVIYFTEFQNATFLNGQALAITSVTPGVSFTVSFNTPDYFQTSDSGICQSTTQDSGALWVNIGQIAVTQPITFSLLFCQSNLSVAIGPPSGISALKNQTDCTVQWVTPDYPGFIGVRVMLSTDPAGVNPPFTQYGDLVVDVSSSTATPITSTTNTTQTVPTAQITNVTLTNNLLVVEAANTFSQGMVVEISNLTSAMFLNGEELTVISATPTQFTAAFTGLDWQNYTSTPISGTATSLVYSTTTVTTSTIMTTNFSSVDVPYSTINATAFYTMLSTVIQDPETNIVYESVQNGPLLCGYVNLKVANPTDFLVLQRKEDIAGRLIAQVNKQLPNLDLSPRSEIRDIFIDPFSIEVANMSVREWFARVSTSISAISQVDNTNGNGISDPFQSSPYKQQIARAYGMSPTDTQNLINKQFDLLAEQAGLTRGAAATATVIVTFYTYQQPQSSITIPEGVIIGSVPDSITPALQFQTQGSATLDISNLVSFYNSQTGWWGISVPAQCTQPGSVGNVGAGTLRQTVSGAPTGINVTNPVGAQFGTDQESNSAFAARIQARLVTGIDNSSRNGYLDAALSTPGVIGAKVVAAGDLEMLRDWDPTRQKHVFGCVDIYVRGTTLSQNDEFIPFQYANNGTYGIPSTYATLKYIGNNQFQVQNYNNLEFVPYDAVELLVNQALYIGLDNAQFNTATGVLNVNPSDVPYQYEGSTTTLAKVAVAQPDNKTVLQQVSGSPLSYTFQLFMRLSSPFIHVPSLQPVLQVYSVTGEANLTGSVSSNGVSLIHTSDFLLTGGSNNAGDTVQIPLISTPTTSTITLGSLTSPTLIAQGMNQPLSSTGVPQDVLSVRSTDSSTLYEFGTDYSIVSMGPYKQYGLQPLTSQLSLTVLQLTSNVVTVTCPNEFASAIAAGENPQVSFTGIIDPTFAVLLNNAGLFTIATAAPAQFTFSLTQPDVPLTPTQGTVIGSALQVGQPVVVTYNEYGLYERLSYVFQESQVLNGALPTTLDNDGFVQNTWLPQSYTTGIPAIPPAVPSFPGTYPVAPGGTNLGYSLILDGWDSAYGVDGGLDIVGSLASIASGLVGNQVPYANRYIKVTYFNGMANVLMKENLDYTLTVDPASGQATITRILPTSRIPDGSTVLVTYFINETFTISTQYPTFVEMLANTIATSQAAACSVLIKAMVANPVDITLAITLDASTSAETVDPVIRTATGIVLDNSKQTLYQSELVQQIQNITGVQCVEIPLLKCAKSDGSYDIGIIVPTGTAWTPLASDPAFIGVSVPTNSWITTNPVLPDSTLPSGGEPTAIVDFLYQGQAFQRQSSITNFLTNAVVVSHLAVAPGIMDATPGSFYLIGTNDLIAPATITATSLTGNTLTVSCIGNFAIGQTVQLSDTAEAFLNGQVVTVASQIKNSGGSQTGFTTSFFGETSYTNTNDIGSVLLPASYSQKVIVTIPADVPNPGNLSYFCTYQVFNENGAEDITVSSTEYLAPGTITINYLTSNE